MPKRISVCPKCNSPQVRQATSLSGWLMPDEWVCDSCGYQGVLVKEIEVED